MALIHPGDASSRPPGRTTTVTVTSLQVSVPVLSVQITDVEPRVSTAARTCWRYRCASGACGSAERSSSSGGGSPPASRYALAR